jgi:uncharacterized protein YidB (DUF937 family)
MGILEDLLGNVMADQGSRGGRARQAPPVQAGGSDMGSLLTALLPVVLSMLASRGSGAGPSGPGASRGGLGDILGQVLGGGAGGGLGGLLEQMQRAGLGEQGRSWVGTGQNMPISPDVLGQIFGQSGVAEIARRAGVTPQQASTGLSELLPEVVDHVTPSGQLPDLDQLAASIENLRRRMGA